MSSTARTQVTAPAIVVQIPAATASAAYAVSPPANHNAQVDPRENHMRNVYASILMTLDLARAERRPLNDEEGAELEEMAQDFARTVGAMARVSK